MANYCTVTVLSLLLTTISQYAGLGNGIFNFTCFMLIWQIYIVLDFKITYDNNYSSIFLIYICLVVLHSNSVS